MEISQEEADRLTEMATAVCRRKFQVRDIEYQSAINLGIAKAILNQHRYQQRSLSSLACLFAIRECYRIRKTIEHWQRQDMAAVDRGVHEKPIPTPVPLLDFELLSFVARHGRTRAARMLGINVPKINDLLHDVARRLDAARSDQAVA